MREIFAIAALGLWIGACGNDVEVLGDAQIRDGAVGEGLPAAAPVAPLAPTADLPMYQGGQRDFRTQRGGTCKGRVAAAMASTGFCFLAADDRVKCAGLIAGIDHGARPTDIGQTGVEQIMLFFFDDGMCVTKTDHTVHCMGTNQNAFGTTISPTFARWTARSDLAAIASGTWDQICGITLTGQVYCGGLGNPNYGNPPIAVGQPGQRRVWVDTSGAARLSDAAVLRAGESRTECTVRANGLVCGGTSFGPMNGTVVNGSRSSSAQGDFTCWLDSAGTVGCTTGPRFEAGKVLHLAASYYTDSLCAIYNDGSIWCVGSNSNGKLGTGDTAPLATETMVAPPGTAHVRCD